MPCHITHWLIRVRQPTTIQLFPAVSDAIRWHRMRSSYEAHQQSLIHVCGIFSIAYKTKLNSDPLPQDIHASAFLAGITERPKQAPTELISLEGTL